MGPRLLNASSMIARFALEGHTRTKSSCLPNLRMSGSTTGTGLNSTTHGSGSTEPGIGAVKTVTQGLSRVTVAHRIWSATYDRPVRATTGETKRSSDAFY